MTRALLLATACAATGLALTAVIVVALGYVEDTTIGFDAPHLGLRLTLTK